MTDDDRPDRSPMTRLAADVERDASRPQPRPIDLSGVETAHPDRESVLHLIGTTVAETALGVTGVHELGVTVTLEDGNAVVDLDLVVEYPHPVTGVSDTVRRQVAHAVAALVDGSVIVDIAVTDVHGPFDPPPAVDPADARDAVPDSA